MEHQNFSLPESLIDAARGLEPADAVFTNARVYNPFSCEWMETDFAVSSGRVVGLGSYTGRTILDLKGRRVVPGLIDAHVHIESSLLTPTEYARLTSKHGTTTVIADPHEIANVCGKAGLEYILGERDGLPVDILLMLPSCVPATHLDQGGAALTAEDLSSFLGRKGVLGLAEMMNVPGVLHHDPEVWKKLALSPVIDGHAPLLSGPDLNAYIAAGIASDHECTGRDEAYEKLMRGMYIFIREGSTEKNLEELIPLARPCTVPRLAFATDDRHADMLIRDGHIDDCIRKAVSCGIELEIALRMATLSAAERFRLSDRGALSPGRLADFCVLNKSDVFSVEMTYKCGRPADTYPVRRGRPVTAAIKCTLPEMEDLSIRGSGRAKVIGLIPHQIITSRLEMDTSGDDIPDLDRDILKAVVCSRYRSGATGLGLVHGFGLQEGALAASVSHDAHNLVAVGVDDHDIRAALSSIIKCGGGMAVVRGGEVTLLPLDCAGLMSTLPAGEVAGLLSAMNSRAGEMGSIPEPFMYLSFLALTVIPHMRLTDRGPFDADAFHDVKLF